MENIFSVLCPLKSFAYDLFLPTHFFFYFHGQAMTTGEALRSLPDPTAGDGCLKPYFFNDSIPFSTSPHLPKRIFPVLEEMQSAVPSPSVSSEQRLDLCQKFFQLCDSQTSVGIQITWRAYQNSLLDPLGPGFLIHLGEVGPRICISDKLAGYTCVAGPRTLLWAALLSSPSLPSLRPKTS